MAAITFCFAVCTEPYRGNDSDTNQPMFLSFHDYHDASGQKALARMLIKVAVYLSSIFWTDYLS